MFSTIPLILSPRPIFRVLCCLEILIVAIISLALASLIFAMVYVTAGMLAVLTIVLLRSIFDDFD